MKSKRFVEQSDKRVEEFAKAFLCWKKFPTEGNAYRVVHLMNYLSSEEIQEALRIADKA